jgi:hypothetical protein
MWKKLGVIFTPGGAEWMVSHAQNPLPEPLGGGQYRVHFASRDRQNRSRGGYFEFDIANPAKTLDYSTQPTLDLGELGAFDDAGVMPSALVDTGTARWLYYTGWSRTVDVPFAFHIGLAAAEPGGRAFTRVSRGPVLGRSHHDPFITGAPCVIREDGAFKMWYIAGTKWERTSGQSKPKHYYTVKYAHSSDGLTWRTSDHLCIEYGRDEYAIARPVVFKDDIGYRMWFTFRGGADTYRIGTAASIDGIHWQRHPTPLAIDVTVGDWDANMICYAYPFWDKGRMYALYNGNDYGATGVGLAMAEP